MVQQSISNNKCDLVFPIFWNKKFDLVLNSKYFAEVPSFNPSSCCLSARPRHSSTLLSRFYTFLLYLKLVLIKSSFIFCSHQALCFDNANKWILNFFPKDNFLCNASKPLLPLLAPLRGDQKVHSGVTKKFTQR